ncbi:MAG: hypothetical protein F4082_00960 [Gammaproteobacteria bacterium]|nr:hypothetical protein [Gammaproteobacteria bacterium]
MEVELEQTLIDRLVAKKPDSLLLISPEVPPGLASCLESAPEIEFEHTDFESIEKSILPLGRYDFVIVADLLNRMDVDLAEQLVCMLRDLHAKVLWVMVPQKMLLRYNHNNAIAQGMRMISPKQFGSDEPQWYEFSLESYKPVPQWLNAKNWANPERWDKERW